jgi:hypothetical protein
MQDSWLSRSRSITHAHTRTVYLHSTVPVEKAGHRQGQGRGEGVVTPNELQSHKLTTYITHQTGSLTANHQSIRQKNEPKRRQSIRGENESGSVAD